MYENNPNIDPKLQSLTNNPGSSLVASLKDIKIDEESSLSEYTKICRLLDPVIENLEQENPEFNPESSLALVTNRPVYYSGFLKSNEKKVLAVLQTDRHGQIAIVLTKRGNYDAYKVTMDENGILQHSGNGASLFSKDRLLRGFGISLARGVCQHPDFGSQNTLNSEQLDSLETQIENDLTAQIEQIKNKLIADLEPEIARIRTVG